MAELFEAVVSWPTLLMVLLVFGFLPGTVLRAAVRCYPKGDPRRAELVNDLYVMRPVERPLWVVTQLETALHEGIPERARQSRARSKTLRGRQRRAYGLLAGAMLTGGFGGSVTGGYVTDYLVKQGSSLWLIAAVAVGSVGVIAWCFRQYLALWRARAKLR